MERAEHLELAKAFASGTNALAIRLFQVVHAGSSSNVATGPASIQLALAMAAMGARGETRDQMRSVMGVDDDADLARLMAAVLALWDFEVEASRRDRRSDGEAPVVLNVASQIFPDRRVTLETAFVELARKALDAPLHALDFQGDPEGARRHINDWVASQTDGKIDELIPSGGTDSLTRLVVASAMYFKGRWAMPFPPEATRKRMFEVDGRKKPVPTMTVDGHFEHVRSENVEIVTLPYIGGRFSLTVAMPTGRRGLEKLESRVDADRWATWRSAASLEHLELRVPRFSVRPGATFDLGHGLRELGMVEAFRPRLADFAGITGELPPDDRFFIGPVFHQAVIEVDEEGTVASAATALGFRLLGSPPPPPPVLAIDKPFLFSIQDEASGSMLFFGRVTDPRA